jgi:hypothetical protein
MLIRLTSSVLTDGSNNVFIMQNYHGREIYMLCEADKKRVMQDNFS